MVLGQQQVSFTHWSRTSLQDLSGKRPLGSFQFLMEVNGE